MKFTTATSTAHTPFRHNPLLWTIAAAYGMLWLVLAIRPVDRGDWVLENLMVAGIVIFLVGSYRALPLSDLSYLAIALFLALHALGAHWTYAQVPVGDWERRLLGSSRNDFDRIVHFSFGLLFAYPIREALLRVVRLRDAWCYPLAFAIVLACGTLFELVEWGAASTLPPSRANAYLGWQGDPWDAQKDLLMAGTGAIVSLSVTAFAARRRARGRPPRT